MLLGFCTIGYQIFSVVMLFREDRRGKVEEKRRKEEHDAWKKDREREEMIRKGKSVVVPLARHTELLAAFKVCLFANPYYSLLSFHN